MKKETKGQPYSVDINFALIFEKSPAYIVLVKYITFFGSGPLHFVHKNKKYFNSEFSKVAYVMVKPSLK